MDDLTRVQRFQKLLANKPEGGAFLTSLDGKPVPIHVEHKPDRGEGKTRVMWTYAVVADDGTGWYLSDDTRGVTCLIMSDSQSELVAANGGSDKGIEVSELYVVRQNFRGTALLCELVE